VLWLVLFKGGKALEVWVSREFSGVSGQNRPDRFAKWSDRFPLHVSSKVQQKWSDRFQKLA
jgi:hypothetical protein